jgi:hypothetical protein
MKRDIAEGHGWRVIVAQDCAINCIRSKTSEPSLFFFFLQLARGVELLQQEVASFGACWKIFGQNAHTYAWTIYFSPPLYPRTHSLCPHAEWEDRSLASFVSAIVFCSGKKVEGYIFLNQANFSLPQFFKGRRLFPVSWFSISWSDLCQLSQTAKRRQQLSYFKARGNLKKKVE